MIKTATAPTATPTLAPVPKLPSEVGLDSPVAAAAVPEDVPVRTVGTVATELLAVMVVVILAVCLGCVAASSERWVMLKTCEFALAAVSPWKKTASTKTLEKVRFLAVLTTQCVLVILTPLSEGREWLRR